MTVPVSKVVKVTILTSPTFPARKGFGLLNIVGDSARLPSGDRIRFYSDITDVAVDFQTTDPEYLAASVFFAQSPKPSEIAISRAFPNAMPAELLGSLNYDPVIAHYNAINSGSLSIAFDGVTKNLTAIDLTSAANMNAVAAAIQAKLTVALSGATIIYDGTRFIVRGTTTGADKTIGFATTPGSGTDLAPLLGLRAVDLGVATAGFAAESITATLNALQIINQSWYGVTLALNTTATTQQVLDTAAWTETQTKVFGVTRSDSNILDGSVTVDIASTLKALGYSRTVMQYDNNDPYAILSFIARAFTVNFNGQNTTLTMKFKLEPGVTPVNLTESQRLALVAKCCNYYTYFGDSAMIAEGVMVNGRFFDEVHGLDWLQNAIETNVFGYLYTTTTKVPQTDKGVARLTQQVEKACREGVNNGLLAPGQWNGMDLGEVKSGDYLPKGFYVYAQPVSEQNQSDREARKAPPIQVIAKGAGAIHFADITVTFER